MSSRPTRQATIELFAASGRIDLPRCGPSAYDGPTQSQLLQPLRLIGQRDARDRQEIAHPVVERHERYVARLRCRLGSALLRLLRH